MVAASQKSITWNFDVLPRRTKKALDFLSRKKWLTLSGWYLAGGTALTIQAGNRTSYDLDFFTQSRDFDTKKLLAHFIKNVHWKTEIEEKNTVYGELFGAKVSFIANPFFIPKQRPVQYGSIRVLQPIDIAVMKVTAISQRGKKRDFFDLYWCAHHIEPLDRTITRLKTQYPAVAHDYHHILKSLVYFDDAEQDPTPEIHFDAAWKDIKKFFEKEIPKITKKIVGLR